jgi:glycosyltransferase involved in cell wall biosynthesis
MKKTLRILHVINFISPKYGGAAIASQLIAKHIAKIGYDVTICTTNLDFPIGTLNVPVDKAVTGTTCSTFHFKVVYRPLLFSPSLWRWLVRNISSFDLVHIHGLYRFPVSMTAWLARRKKVPYLIRPHGSLDPFLYKRSRYNVFLKRLYERLVDFPNLKNASAIHYTSEEEAKRAEFLNLNSKFVIIPNGIHWDTYSKLPSSGIFKARLKLSNQTPLVLFLGRISYEKGLDMLVPAFSQVTKRLKTAHLAIVGPDNDGYMEKVKKWCRNYQIRSKVSFIGYLNAKEAIQAYVDANVFVLPSYTENFAMTVVESMACGCPVVISDQVKIWRTVKSANAGVVTPLSVRSIANAIEHVLLDKKAAELYSRQGRITARSHYSLPNIVGRLSDVYRRIIDRTEVTAA